MGNLRIQSLAAQVDVQEPVVEAAIAYVVEYRDDVKYSLGPTGTALIKAIREYEAALKGDG